MTRPRSHPLWWAAPFRLARTPGWAVLVLVAATLFVGSVVAPALFVETARSTALSDGLAAGAAGPYGDQSGDLRVTWDGVVSDIDPFLDPLSAMPSYGEPTVTATGVGQSQTNHPVARADGTSSPAVLWYHDGALAALGAADDDPGVWLPTATADELHLKIGDELKIGMEQTFLGTSRHLRPITLSGTYEPEPGSPLPADLAALPDSERWFLPHDPTSPKLVTPMAIVSRATFDRIAPKVQEHPFYVADLLLDPDVTPDEAAVAVDQTAAYGDAAFDGSTPVYGELADALPAPASLDVITGLPSIVDASESTSSSARTQVRPYAVAGEVLAGLLLVAAWVLIGLNRRREQLLASGLGLRPLELTLLAALEALLLCVLAVPAGVGLAQLGVAVAGPPTVAGVPITQDEVVHAAVAGAVGLLLIAVTAGFSALATDRLDRISRLGRSRVSVPWGTALVVVTVVVGFAVLTVEITGRATTPLTTAFPFLVTASVAMLVIRGGAWVRAHRSTRARPGTPRWLAARRTGPVLREVVALSAVVAVSLGLFAYTLTVQRGIDQGVADKTAALAGTETTLEVVDDFRGQGTDRAVYPPVDDTTLVWRRNVALPPNESQVPLMAIDPGSFADVADWGGSGELDAGRALVPRLPTKERGLPVILAGDTNLKAGAETLISFDSVVTVPVYVLGVVDAFPGSETEPGSVTVVIDSRRLFKLVPPPVDPRKKVDPGSIGPGGQLTSVVWSQASGHALRSQLGAADITTDGTLETATEARVENGLVASTWAAGYVLALGGVVLALALAAGLVLALRLSDRDAVSDVLLRRMGYRPADLARARAWEVGYAVATAVVAALIAAAVLVLGPVIIDAAARIPPLSQPRPQWSDLVWLLGVLVALVLLAWVAGTVLTRRRSAAEVLRAGG
ncbi:hypothetical protein ABLE68_13530 [Nocardioides sp. CN2-186]|uniref:hypothetical protein n=1 Tax=Nocardioides tweenelious TaxID=3156607 RepID=UPI0032B5955A